MSEHILWMKKNWWQVVVVCIALFVALSYSRNLNKQAEIQTARLEADKRKYQQEILEKNKIYVAKRKGECYDIFQKEFKRVNNASGHEYDEADDRCLVWYRDGNIKGTRCFEFLTDTLYRYLNEGERQRMYRGCVNKEFYKER